MRSASLFKSEVGDASKYRCRSARPRQSYGAAAPGQMPLHPTARQSGNNLFNETVSRCPYTAADAFSRWFRSLAICRSGNGRLTKRPIYTVLNFWPFLLMPPLTSISNCPRLKSICRIEKSSVYFGRRGAKPIKRLPPSTGWLLAP